MRMNDHRRGMPIPNPAEDDYIWSPRELARAVGEPSIAKIPLPGITPEEQRDGLVAGWKKQTVCEVGMLAGKPKVAFSTERWELGKWPVV